MAATDAKLTCPDDGQVRAHVDTRDPAVSAHVEWCDACADRLREVRSTAQWSARTVAALGADAPDVDVDAAWRARPRPVTDLARRRLPSRGATGAIAAAFVTLLVAVLVVVTPTGRQAAADFLSRFRSERLTVVTFDPSDPSAGLEGLGDIAEIDADGRQPRPVDDVDEAARVAGFTPTRPSALPDGAAAPRLVAGAPSTVRVTFSADRAPDLPPELDGARLVVRVPGTVLAQYAVGDDEVFVAESGELGAEAEGADLATIRDYLLSRPEVPDNVARQLLAIDDWTATLPVPLPVDRAAWRDITVAGQPGLAIEDAMGAGVMWHAGDRIHAVASTSGDVDEVRRLADSIGG